MREIRRVRDEAQAARVRERNQVHTGTETLTQQQFRDEVDVNTIVGRFGVDRLAAGADLGGVYADVSGVTGYEEAEALVRSVQERFQALAPEIREKFRNDPGELVRASSVMELDELQALVYPPKAEEKAPEAPDAASGGDGGSEEG